MGGTTSGSGGGEALPYHPYYCEENAFLACERLRHDGSAMLFIFGAGPWVTMRAQRTGGVRGVVRWDYHVVTVVRRGDAWSIHDPDSYLPTPLEVGAYLSQSIADSAATRFRLLPWEGAARHFGSDRSHMRADDGTWLQPPPPWPAIHPERASLPACLARDASPLGPALRGVDALVAELRRLRNDDPDTD